MIRSLVTAILAFVAFAGSASARPPNFIVIFADDQGYQDLGCFGSPKIRTPNIDRMAAEGMRFTDFYVAAPICTPSRAALLTGCYPQRVGLPNVLFPNAEVGISRDEVTIAELLRERGYATACVGKWHLGHHPQFLPTNHGFDTYFGLPYSNDMSPLPEHRGNGRPNPKFPLLPLIRNLDTVELNPDQAQLTRRYTEEAIRFIEASKDRPFFLYLPHIPLYASERFRGKSPRGLYGDVIEEIDWSVGEILKTLDRLGLDERTLVLYTSDNGPWLGFKELGGSALPLRGGKFTAFEGGMREPCVVRWPNRIPAGAVCKELATTMDLLPTFARLAGTNAPTDRIIDGEDIWPLLAGEPEARTPHEKFLYYRQRELHAVRSGKWKLHVPWGKKRQPDRESPEGKVTLYNLDADISETTDIADKHPKVVKRLLSYIDEARADLGDSLAKREGKNVRPAGQISKP